MGRSVAALLGLLAALPLYAALSAVAALLGRIAPRPLRGTRSGPARTVLLTGGKMSKALQLARSFSAAGHRVVLVETGKYWLCAHRHSRSVDRFHTVPSPERDLGSYADALERIVLAEGVDVFVPVASPVAARCDAAIQERLSRHCEVFHLGEKYTEILDDKFRFCRLARGLGLSAPRVHRITSPEQVLGFDFATDGRRYLLKSLAYDPLHRLDLTELPCPDLAEFLRGLPISEEGPWVMQEFVPGREYCTHSTVRDGVLRAHCCSASSPFQVDYEQVDHPAIEAWVREFVSRLGLTGQVSFDFIVTGSGEVMPIECNPRTHSAITMFHDHPDLAEAYLGPPAAPDAAPITPLPGSRPTWWISHELWRLLGIRSVPALSAWGRRLVRGTDAVLRRDDPLPFLMLHAWHIPLLLLLSLRAGRRWIRIDFNIGKLVEPGGD